MCSGVPPGHRAAPHRPTARPPDRLASPPHKSPTRWPTAAGSFKRPKGGGMPRRYETVYIFDSALEEPAVSEKLEKFHALLTRDGKGTISNVAHWGKRTRAYRVKKKGAGYRVGAQFESAPALFPEYGRLGKPEGGVLGFVGVVNEAPPARRGPAPVIGAEDEEREGGEA